MAADERTWTTVQLCRLADLSYRQADWLERSGVLDPVRGANGSGSRRRWSSRQVLVARALGCLSSIGVGPEMRRTVADRLMAAPPSLWSQRVLITPDGELHTSAHLSLAVFGWSVDLAQVWADAEQAMAAELDGELALVS